VSDQGSIDSVEIQWQAELEQYNTIIERARQIHASDGDSELSVLASVEG
jgi:hypothetical protein